jgi:hypothetical protein
MSTLPTGLPGCGQPATIRFEMYSLTPEAGTHGKLDASVYVCDEHAEQARSAIEAAGLTAFRMQGPGKRCGDGYDFAGDEPGPLHAPEPAGTAGPEHPAWCDGQTHDDNPELNMHGAELGEVVIEPEISVFVALIQKPDGVPMITIMNDRDSSWLDLPADQAAGLRDLLTIALGRLGAGDAL